MKKVFNLTCREKGDVLFSCEFSGYREVVLFLKYVSSELDNLFAESTVLVPLLREVRNLIKRKKCYQSYEIYFSMFAYSKDNVLRDLNFHLC